VPPLAGAGRVAVAEAGEVAVGGQRGDRPEAGPADVGADVAAPGLQQLGAVAHRLAVDATTSSSRRSRSSGCHGTSLIASFPPRANPAPPVAADAAHREPGEQLLGIPPIGRGARDHRTVLRLTVREPVRSAAVPPQADRALPADRRLADAEPGQQAGRRGELPGHRRDRPPERQGPRRAQPGPGQREHHAVGAAPRRAERGPPGPAAAAGQRGQLQPGRPRPARQPAHPAGSPAADRPRPPRPRTGSGRRRPARNRSRSRCRAACRTGRRAALRSRRGRAPSAAGHRRPPAAAPATRAA
jgi:hypothetical protein